MYNESPILCNLSASGLKPYEFFEQLRALEFIEAAYLYGSRARGDYRPQSEIDIAIETRGHKPEYQHMIADILDNADTLLAIDCVNLQAAPPALKMQIAKEGVLLFKKHYEF